MRVRSLLATLLLVFGLLWTGCGSSSSTDGPNGPAARGGAGPGAAPIPSVEATQAQLGALPLEERMSGVVRAENQVAIFPEITAPIVEVLANNGDYVERGAPLVRLRDTQYREQLRQAEASLRISRAEARQAEANLAQLKAQLARTQRLAEQEFQSQQQLEIMKAQVSSAEASHEQALAQIAQAQATVDEQEEALRQTVVRAPISGYVGNRNAEVGMRADGNTQLFAIGNLETVRVEVSVTDEMFGQVDVGQTALINSPSFPDTTVQAEVSRISPFLSEESYTANAEIVIPNAGQLLKPGMFVQVDVLYGESRQATLVPVSALYEDPNSGQLGVFVAPTLGTEIPIDMPETFEEDNPPPLSDATPMSFREVEVVARGRQLVGIGDVEPGTWVVIVGQNLLSQAGSGQVEARVRPVPWQRIVDLQQLQDQDLLRRFMEKQQRLGREAFDVSNDDPPTQTTSSSPPTTLRADRSSVFS